MQMVEVMVAAVVFTAASGSSLQLWSHAAGSSQQLELRQQQLQRIELDRLQLQAHWRRQLTAAPGCGISSEQLMAVVAALPAPPQLQRALLPGPQPGELRVQWRADHDPALQRERLFTAAGLGLCTDPPPLTDSQVEEVLP